MSLPLAVPRDYPPIEEMGDHHQVKTSFLYIRLRSPSRVHQHQPAAGSLRSVTSVEGSSADRAQIPPRVPESLYKDTTSEDKGAAVQEVTSSSVVNRTTDNIPDEASSSGSDTVTKDYAAAQGRIAEESSSDALRIPIQKSNILKRYSIIQFLENCLEKD